MEIICPVTLKTCESTGCFNVCSISTISRLTTQESEQVVLKVKYLDHSTIQLTNESGDTYTSKSEELMDFLHGQSKPTINYERQNNSAI